MTSRNVFSDELKAEILAGLPEDLLREMLIDHMMFVNAVLGELNRRKKEKK